MIEHLTKLLEQIEELDIQEGKFIEICRTIQNISESRVNIDNIPDYQKQIIINNSRCPLTGLSFSSMVVCIQKSDEVINDLLETFVYVCPCTHVKLSRHNRARHKRTQKHIDFFKDPNNEGVSIKLMTPLQICKAID